MILHGLSLIIPEIESQNNTAMTKESVQVRNDATDHYL